MAINLSGLFRQYAQAVIRAGVREGLSGEAILRGIKGEVGQAYRRTNFLADVRQHRLEYDRSQALGALDPSARVTRDLITDQAPRGGLAYEYRFAVTGSDRRTGEAISRYLSVASDRLLTKGDAYAELLASLGISDQGSDQIAIEEAELDAVYSEE